MPQISPNLNQSKAAPHASHSPKLARYVGYFCIGYVLASALMMVVQSQVAIIPQLVTLLSIIVGAYIAVHKFIKHHHRALSHKESNVLTLGGAASVWVLSGIYFLALWMWVFDPISREVLIEMTMQRPAPLVGALFIIIMLTLIATRLSIWAFNRLLNPVPRPS